MITFFKLFWANIKMTVRNRQALFWQLVFPIIFIVIFGLFNMDSFATSKILIIDRADTTVSHKIVDGMKEIDLFKAETSTDYNQLDNAKGKLKRSELDFILVIPETVKDIPESFTPKVTIDPKTMQPSVQMPDMPTDVKMTVYYNEANVASNQFVLNMLDQVTTEINANASGAPKIFTLDKQALSNRQVRYIDFLVPGILAMSLMQSGIIGIAVYIAEAREKKILKRILATPIDRKTFIAAQVLSRLALSFVQAVIIILTAKILYDVNIYGAYWAVAVWALLGTLVFLNIGFIIAGFSKTASAAESLSQVISMPMMFLSGVFFSTDTLPKFVQKLVDILPLTPVIDALRNIINNGEPFSSTLPQLWIVLPWLAGTFIVAMLVFRVARD